MGIKSKLGEDDDSGSDFLDSDFLDSDLGEEISNKGNAEKKALKMDIRQRLEICLEEKRLRMELDDFI